MRDVPRGPARARATRRCGPARAIMSIFTTSSGCACTPQDDQDKQGLLIASETTWLLEKLHVY
jgi:hypothetical protein